MDKLIKMLDGSSVPRPKPICFFLDWQNRNAEWRGINNLPDKKTLKFSTTVKWKDYGHEIKICSNYHIPSVKLTNSRIGQQRFNESYLKSHLQKCVRRSNCFKALKTAKHFMDISIENFLRRLSIIAAEDSLPLEGYSILVWLISATSKGYLLSDSQIAWCYGYLYSICQCPYYEPGISCDEIQFKRFRTSKLAEKNADLVYSLYFRKGYGGLGDDKKMLNGLTKLWYQRGLANSLFLDRLQRDNNIFITPPTEPLINDEWLLAALDFHCCPYLLGNLADKYEQFTESELKSAIWYFSSSRTNKQVLVNIDSVVWVDPGIQQRRKLAPVWKVISRSFFSNARYFLKTQ